MRPDPDAPRWMLNVLVALIVLQLTMGLAVYLSERKHEALCGGCYGLENAVCRDCSWE